MRGSTLWLLAVVVFAACPKPDPDPTTPTDGGSTSACTESVTTGTPLRLLTRVEYNNTIRDLLGVTGNPAAAFPREPLSQGLDNNAALLQVSSDGVSRYLEAAEALSVDAVTNHRDLLVPCTTTDATCASFFVTEFGRKAYRRPLTTEERGDLQTLFGTAQAASDFNTAMQWTLQSMLQSPQFLYRDESALGSVPNQPIVKLSGFELATRLSYFLWASTPDASLLIAAANGDLDTPRGLTMQAQRMLDDPRAVDGMLRVLSLWLYLDGVQTVEKNTTVYPQYSHELAQAWRRSLELYMIDVLNKEGTLKALLTSNVLFSNDTMNVYGVTAPSSDFVRTEMTGTTRRGLLAQPGFLAFKAMPDGSSPVRRGIFVLNQLICQVPPPPPAGAAIIPPAPSTSKTTRERFANHSTDPGCHGCHVFIDPPGFVFEHYDGLGVWRDTENGQPIDSSGGIVNATETTLNTPVSSVSDLENLLGSSRQVHDCMAGEFYRFALGRELTAADSCTVQHVSDAFMRSGGEFKALMLAIVQTNAFRQNANPEMTP
jgi:Protein of unknown function (DUF1592)/Protein of unknown function (DUF1588)/Protein of unknown function (DUF1595)/Protein of unknown function (DUF1587)/Protein of unknown function (DUF1585)